jgi:RHS repeat-associated protein
MLSASQTGHALSFTYDALGRNLTQVGPQGTVTSAYDIGGRRTRITHADGFYVDQDHLVTGEVSAIRENGATSGVGVLASFAYDDCGRRTSLTRGNGTSTSYTYDAASRLSQLTDNPAGTTHDQTLGFSYNPASQIVSNTRSNDLFSWAGNSAGTTNSTANGLNQITAVGGTSTSHDTRGNMTADGLGKAFGYSSENLLNSASGGVTLSYDPSMRLYQVAGATTTRFAYDGADLIAEYNASNTLQRRYVHGPGSDEPLVWYEGTGTTDRRFLHADERGSIAAVSNSSSTVTNVNIYDEYGRPDGSNLGRFQYTGQKWIGDIGLYDYKARMYHPALGRFLQGDPIGYGDGMNLYAYVGGDPVNSVDPTGLFLIAPRLEDPDRPEEPDRSWDTRSRSYDGMGIRTSGGSASRLETMAFEREQRSLRAEEDHYAGRRGRGQTPRANQQELLNQRYRVLTAELAILAPGATSIRSTGPVSMTVIESLEARVHALRYQPFSTASEARQVANALGYAPVRGYFPHGSPVFTNNRNFITPDNMSATTGRTHNGGVWKMADSIRGLWSRETRRGTYTRDLDYIGP